MTNAQSAPLSVHTPPNNYRPSVPMSVYRDLAAELEQTKLQLETLNTQNQLLVVQNQALRAEIIKVIETHLYLEEFVSSLPPVSAPISDQPPPSPQSAQILPLVVESEPVPVNPIQTPELEAPTPKDIPPAVVIEKSDPPPSPAAAKADISGWLIIAMMILIVSSAFVGGFLIVHPLLNNHGDSTIKTPNSSK